MADVNNKLIHFCVFFLFVSFINPTLSDIIVQGKNCGSQTTPLVVRMTQKDEDIVRSHSDGMYYEPNRDCIVTLIGKQYYQFQIELRRVDIDGRRVAADYCKGWCCNDYLKLFNAYRVDNARLFPIIGWKGLCGKELPARSIYTTSHNFFTIQFRTDQYSEQMTGFVLNVKQFLRRNDGNINPEGGYIGGWNDGTYNILQLDWTEQEQIPGDLQPGGNNNDYGQGTGGRKCYECIGCRIDFFDPNSGTDRAEVKTGCHVCSKEFQNNIAGSNRRCYNRLQYESLLLTLTDTATGSGQVKDYRGCRSFMNVQGISINYCFCDSEDLCNRSGKVPFSLLLLLVCTLSSVLLWGFP